MYTIAKVLPTTRQVKLIRKKEFATVAFDLEDKVFVVYVTSISQNLGVHSSRRAR